MRYAYEISMQSRAGKHFVRLGVGKAHASREEIAAFVRDQAAAGFGIGISLEFARGWSVDEAARAIFEAVLAHARAARVWHVVIGVCPASANAVERGAALDLLRACADTAQCVQLPTTKINAEFFEAAARLLPRFTNLASLVVDAPTETSAIAFFAAVRLLHANTPGKILDRLDVRVRNAGSRVVHEAAACLGFARDVKFVTDFADAGACDEFARAFSRSRTVAKLRLCIWNEENNKRFLRAIAAAVPRALSQNASVDSVFGGRPDEHAILEAANERARVNRAVMALYSAGIARLGAGSPAAAKFVRRDGDTAIGHRIAEFLV